jgi:hypothetical protein
VSDKIDTKRCWVDEVDFGFGFTMFVCFAREWFSPVGFVWGVLTTTHHKKATFDVCGSYVIKGARRMGIRTRINQAILERAEIITTNQGSHDGGEAFMCAFGYELDSATDSWHYVKRKAAKKK